MTLLSHLNLIAYFYTFLSLCGWFHLIEVGVAYILYEYSIFYLILFLINLLKHRHDMSTSFRHVNLAQSYLQFFKPVYH